MKDRLISLRFEVYDNFSNLDTADARLLQAAMEALAHSYAPYSDFRVAAALRLSNGQILTGSNQENASYPLCLCAERVALAAAHALHPSIAITDIAITAANPDKPVLEPVSPCGACRQVMVEAEQRYRQPMRIILSGERGQVFIMPSASALLPLSFNSSYL